MPRFREPLDGGVVTARNPVDLRPGELQQATEVVYHPNDPGPRRVPARTQATSSGLDAAATGLTQCNFDYVNVTVELTKDSTSVTATTTTIVGVSLTSGSAVITAPTTGSFIGLKVGAGISGTNIQANTTVLTWDSPTQITMSLTALASSTSDLTFTNEGFDGVSTGASVVGLGIPNGATFTKLTRTTGTLSAAATLTTRSKLTFTADDYLIAQTNNKYRKATMTATGTGLTFSDIESVTEGPALESIHYSNHHVLLNGVNPNRVLKADGSTRPHGLAPVGPPTLSIVSGTWALKDGTGFYAYWVTEYDSVNDIESDVNFGVDEEGKAKKPPIIQISNIATDAVQIDRPARVNPTATHWLVYRSVKYVSTTRKGADKENHYPNGFLVAKLELRDDDTQTSVKDGGGLTSTSALFAGATGLVGTSSSNLTWATPSNAVGSGTTTYAKLIYAAGSNTANVYVPLELTTFGVTGVTAPIVGFTVAVRGRRVGNGLCAVTLAKANEPIPPITNINGLPIGATGLRPVPFTTSDTTITLGGTSDTWGRKWDISDLANGKFVVRVFGSVSQNKAGVADEVWIDTVSVIVSYGETQEASGSGTILNTGDPYQAVTVAPFGFEISSGRGGQPPRAFTGDVYQDSLVTNDVLDKSILRYSFPTRFDSFPAAYFLKFSTGAQDEIVCFRTVGEIGVTLSLSQIYRVNSLPRTTDSEFDRGRAVSRIEVDHGCAGRKAVSVFTLPGTGPMLAYANAYGLFLTDGYRVRPLTTALDWDRLVDKAHLSKCRIVNNRELNLLEFHYVPIDAVATTYTSAWLALHYHASQLKEGPFGPELKVTGPHTLTTAAAAVAILADGTHKLYTSETTGSFHVRYSDTTRGAGLPIVRTRKIVHGFGDEWSLSEVYPAYAQRNFSAGSPAQINVYARVSKAGVVERQSTTKSFNVLAYAGAGTTNPVRRTFERLVVPEVGEGIDLTLETASFPGTERFGFDYIVYHADGKGVETGK